MSREYPACLYTAVHPGNPGDTQFYREVCRDSVNVLELGCGTGRIGSILRQDGLHVVGIDIDEECIEIAQELGIEAHLSDIRTFQLGCTFDRIIAPYNVLYSLLDDESVAECFNRVAQHLHKEGEFWFDGYCTEALHQAEASDDTFIETVEFVATVEFQKKTYDVIESGSWNRNSQFVHAQYRHIPRDQSAVITTEIPQRYLRTSQARELLEGSGLEISKMYGGFNRGSFLPESEFFIACAQLKS